MSETPKRDAANVSESTLAALPFGSEQTRFQLHHNCATGQYAWFTEAQPQASEWWQASPWFDSAEAAAAWDSMDYLRRRAAHVESVLALYRRERQP